MAAKKSAIVCTTHAVPRLPIHRAKLYFHPQFVEDAQAWFQNIAVVIESILDRASIDATVVQGNWSATVRFDRIDYELYADSGIASISERNEDLDDFLSSHSWLGPIGTVDAVTEKIDATDPPEALCQEFWKKVRPFARAFSLAMNSNFELALRTGHGQIEAKFGDLGREFKRIEPDEIRFLRVDSKDREDFIFRDDELDTATTPAGESVYSLGVVALVRSLPEPNQVRKGRPSKYNSVSLAKEADRLMEYNGDFFPGDAWDAQARLEEALAAFCKKTEGKRPAVSTIRVIAKNAVQKYRRNQVKK